jgi:hypothetical protein
LEEAVAAAAAGHTGPVVAAGWNGLQEKEVPAFVAAGWNGHQEKEVPAFAAAAGWNGLQEKVPAFAAVAAEKVQAFGPRLH